MVATTKQEAFAQVTGPGGPMPVQIEDVRGHRLPVFADRARSLREVLAASARHGEAEYLVCGDLRLTYTEHLRRVARLAEALRADHGVGPGDRVAVLSANNAEWIMTFWAASALGAITVGMNAFWSPAEVDYGTERTTPTVIVADDKRLPAARQAAAAHGAAVLSIDQIAALAGTPRVGEPEAGYALPETPIDEDDPAVIIFTSGTSGRPKGATHSHRNVIAATDYFRYNDEMAAAFGRPRTLTRYLMTSPLFHIAALHNLAAPRLVAGDTVVIYTGRFDVDTVLRLIERERIESWGAVPTMATRLVQHGDLSAYDLSSLKVLSLGAAPSSAELKAALREKIPAVAGTLGTNYGQTECSTAAVFATAADLAERPDTVGTPIVNVEVAIRDEDGGGWLPDGEEGEICVRGATVMLGYWNDPVATAETIDADGWLATGDIGVMDQGYLTIASRRSDLILRGGENIYPSEVENALDEHPEVIESAVFGIPHPELGEEVAAVVVLRADAAEAVGGEELCAHLGERIGKYKIPTVWRTTTAELPRNATGKVIRHDLAELLD